MPRKSYHSTRTPIIAIKGMLLLAFVFAFGIYLLFGAYLYFNQRAFIYFPASYAPGLLPQESFTNQNETLYATVLNPGQQRAILYFGGNGEVVDYNADLFSTLFPKHSVYLVKYRGYGHSTGTPTEAGLYADALVIFDTIRQQHQSMALIGRSLGSAIAIYVATQREATRLVLITPFASVLGIAQELYPLYPLRYLLKDQYDSLGRAAQIDEDTLVVAGTEDKIVPKKHTDALVEGLTGATVDYQTFNDMGHNGWSQNSTYHNLLSAFINRGNS